MRSFTVTKIEWPTTNESINGTIINEFEDQKDARSEVSIQAPDLFTRAEQNDYYQNFFFNEVLLREEDISHFHLLPVVSDNQHISRCWRAPVCQLEPAPFTGENFEKWSTAPQNKRKLLQSNTAVTSRFIGFLNVALLFALLSPRKRRRRQGETLGRQWTCYKNSQ
ncbi:hypothetical protein F2P81_004129 [Scophthalmus maximus]|uniref:Uncharacterized protein n=1 Tax=Scophthalmus maximus TaxID=52904 RepID=A0A6A4TL83_SCOMX|nr:hypothetical protein F2P81_004129 [Scophthalmus maximus]